MKEQINNPPAFPSTETADSMGEWGMSLRDYFAGAALSGMLGDLEMMRTMADHDNAVRPAMVATFAYSFADAMLKERE